MYTRINTRPIRVKNLTIGGNNHIIIQSMTNTPTKDVKKTVSQIKKLEKYGCELVRIAILDEIDAAAIPEIKKHINIPLVADIHFDYKLALKCIENGIDKVRINPGNIGNIENVKKVVNACKEKKIPIRIGINSGSLEEDLKQKYGVSAETMIMSAKRHVKILEDLDFYDIIISLKSSDYKMCIDAYKMASECFPYPLHLGITEPGTLISGAIKSTLVMEELIKLNIGNTLRISLSSDPINEIKVAKQILSLLGLYQMPELISCPTCGRTKINVIKYANKIEDFLYTINKPIKVAVMGCVVNGPGEAKNADIGIAGGNKQAVLFKQGKIVKTIPENEIISCLKKEIRKL